MTNYAEVGKRLRTRRQEASFNFVFGLLLLLLGVLVPMREGPAGICLVFGACFLGASAFGVYLSRQLPIKEIMQFAQSKNGLLTLSELTTTLDVDPALAARALKKLQALGIATPRWQEYRKNLWEFPDYVELPLDQSVDTAKRNGNRLTLADLLAQGHSVEVAQQTLETLAREGLARPDPADARAVEVGAK